MIIVFPEMIHMSCVMMELRRRFSRGYDDEVFVSNTIGKQIYELYNLHIWSFIY